MTAPVKVAAAAARTSAGKAAAAVPEVAAAAAHPAAAAAGPAATVKIPGTANMPSATNRGVPNGSGGRTHGLTGSRHRNPQLGGNGSARQLQRCMCPGESRTGSVQRAGGGAAMTAPPTGTPERKTAVGRKMAMTTASRGIRGMVGLVGAIVGMAMRRGGTVVDMAAGVATAAQQAGSAVGRGRLTGQAGTGDRAHLPV